MVPSCFSFLVAAAGGQHVTVAAAPAQHGNVLLAGRRSATGAATPAQHGNVPLAGRRSPPGSPQPDPQDPVVALPPRGPTPVPVVALPPRGRAWATTVAPYKHVHAGHIVYFDYDAHGNDPDKQGCERAGWWHFGARRRGRQLGPCPSGRSSRGGCQHQWWPCRRGCWHSSRPADCPRRAVQDWDDDDDDDPLSGVKSTGPDAEGRHG